MADRRNRKGVSSIWQKLAIFGFPACFVLIFLFVSLYLIEAHRSDHFSQELVQCRGNLNQCRDESGSFERAAARYERAQRVLAFYDASTWMYKSVQLEWTPGYWTTLGACGATACYEVRLTDFKTQQGEEAPLLHFQLSDAKSAALAPASPEAKPSSESDTQSAENTPAPNATTEYQPSVKQNFVLPLELGCRTIVRTLDHEFLFVIEDTRENSSFLGIGVRIGGEQESFGTPVYTCPARSGKLTSELYKAPSSTTP